jgi:hypothetical protein
MCKLCNKYLSESFRKLYRLSKEDLLKELSSKEYVFEYENSDGLIREVVLKECGKEGTYWWCSKGVEPARKEGWSKHHIVAIHSNSNKLILNQTHTLTKSNFYKINKPYV